MLAFALYILGIIGAVAYVTRDAPMGLREYVVVIAWPVVVVGATIWGLGIRFRASIRP